MVNPFNELGIEADIQSSEKCKVQDTNFETNLQAMRSVTLPSQLT